MTQHNTLNVKLSNAQPNKLKYVLKNGNEINFFSSRLTFHINCCQMIHKFQRSLKLSQIVQ